MVGDRRHQPESRRKGSVHLRLGREQQHGAVLGGPQDRRDQPVQGALEGLGDGRGRGDDVERGHRDRQGAAVGRQARGGEQQHGAGQREERPRAERAPGGQPAQERRERLGRRAGVGEVGEGPRGAVGAPGLAGDGPQDAAGRGVRRSEGAADQQGVEGDAGRGDRGQDGDHRPAFADGQDDHAAQPDRPADAVEPVGEGGGGAGVGGGVVVGLVEGEVDHVPAGLEDHRAERERPHVVAAAGGAEGESGVVRVLLGPVEGGVEPRAERGVPQGVAGELAVGAVQHEGDDQQQSGGDETAAGAGGRAARRYERGDQRGGGDLVGVRPRRAHQRAM